MELKNNDLQSRLPYLDTYHQSVFCLLSSVFRLPSSVFRHLSSVFRLHTLTKIKRTLIHK
jgi:hypothetical protein